MTMNPSPLTSLNDPTLLKTDGLIDGRWVSGGSRFAVHDPATGHHLANVANLDADHAQAAITGTSSARRSTRLELRA